LKCGHPECASDCETDRRKNSENYENGKWPSKRETKELDRGGENY